MMPLISKTAFDLIVTEEIGSKKAYESRYSRPVWPGGASGVTIGIGYDVGAGVSSREQLQRDWTGHIPQAMIDALAGCIGVTGERARALAANVRSRVNVPWDAAMAVFEKNTLPKYYTMTARALPNFETLSLDCKGALVSLVYNRGAGGFNNSNDRSREMRSIKRRMTDKVFDGISTDFRSMKRLWPSMPNLGRRRDREASLFERGLRNPATTPEAKAAAATAVVGAGTTAATNTGDTKKTTTTIVKQEGKPPVQPPVSSGVITGVVLSIVAAIAAFFLVRWLTRQSQPAAPNPDTHEPAPKLDGDHAQETA